MRLRIRDKSETMALWAVLIGSVLFGCSGVVGKHLFHNGITPVELTAFRTIISAGCILLFALLWDRSAFRVTRSQLWFLVQFSFMLTMVQLSFFAAVSLTSVAIAITLQYSAPLFVMAWERIVRKTPIGPLKVLLVVVALTGCVLLTQAYDIAFLRDNAWGILAGLGCGAVFATFNIMGNRVARRGIGNATASLYSFGLSSLVFIGIAPFYMAGSISIDVSLVPLILFIGIGATFLPYVLLMLGLRRLGAFKATLIGMIDPISAAVLAFIFLGETLSIVQSLGMLMILGVILLTGREHRV